MNLGVSFADPCAYQRDPSSAAINVLRANTSASARLSLEVKASGTFGKLTK
jgi:hypothetical protein